MVSERFGCFFLFNDAYVVCVRGQSWQYPIKITHLAFSTLNYKNTNTLLLQLWDRKFCRNSSWLQAVCDTPIACNNNTHHQVRRNLFCVKRVNQVGSNLLRLYIIMCNVWAFSTYCKVISGALLVRLTTCRRLTDILPKLSLITLLPPETAG